MKNLESGITMTSLVITIIVLMIISWVAIRELSDQGLVFKVKNETQKQQIHIDEEQNKMDRVKNEQLQDWGF